MFLLPSHTYTHPFIYTRGIVVQFAFPVQSSLLSLILPVVLSCMIRDHFQLYQWPLLHYYKTQTLNNLKGKASRYTKTHTKIWETNWNLQGFWHKRITSVNMFIRSHTFVTMFCYYVIYLYKTFTQRRWQTKLQTHSRSVKFQKPQKMQHLLNKNRTWSAEITYR